MISMLFVGIGMSNAFEVKSAMDNGNIWYAVLLSFAGPSVWGSSLTQALTWLVPHVLFFYLVGNIANEELLNRGYAIVPLMGSRRTWWLGKLLLAFLLSMGYTLLWFLFVSLGAAFVLPVTWAAHPFLHSGDPWIFPSNINIADLLLWIFSLYIGTLFTLITVQMFISIWWRRSFHAYVLVVAVSILSWLLGTDQPELVRWLPGSQSMLSRHTFLDPSIQGFTFGWSLLYNGLILLLMLGGSFWHIRRMDIFGASLAEIR
ncbi:MAG: hypothetical protein ACOYYF_14515 [Chloroflexota bacterium]|nr:hypothetical protein [Chloroflexota bacterium]